jgi:hypothetical protein
MLNEADNQKETSKFNNIRWNWPKVRFHSKVHIIKPITNRW